MAVIGAILGDIAGSQFEFNRPENLDYKHCELFTNRCSYTDDMIMTLAVKKAILADADFTKTMREVGQPYPYSGYGGSGCTVKIRSHIIALEMVRQCVFLLLENILMH